MSPSSRTFPQCRILPTAWSRLYLAPARITILALPEMGQVMKHAWLIFIELMMDLRLNVAQKIIILPSGGAGNA